MATLVAFLLSAIVIIGIYHVRAIDSERDNCAEERKNDQVRIKELTSIFQNQQEAMLKTILKETYKETSKNDSVIKNSVKNEINNILP